MDPDSHSETKCFANKIKYDLASIVTTERHCALKGPSN